MTNPNRYCVVQTGNGYWGRGKTIEEAASAIKWKVPATDRCVVFVVTGIEGDRLPFIDDFGGFNYHEENAVTRLGMQWSHVKAAKSLD